MNSNRGARGLRASLLKSSSAAILAAGLGVAIAPTASAVVSNGVDTDPTGMIDINNIWNSVGRLFIDQQSIGGGFVCTQTLINPRMVLTAAHCVTVGGGADEGSFYDGAFGSRVGVTFLVNPISGPGGNVQGDFFGDTISPYAIVGSDVIVNPNYDGFFESDVAVIALSQSVPTFGVGGDAAVIDPISLLMSPLDTLEAATVVGYGNTGDGTNATFSSTRRRVGQNVIGYIGSYFSSEVLSRPIDDVWLFGPNLDPDYQQFYMMDFDDPNRGTAEANPFDWDIFEGDAVGSEAITAGGDSGGPLFVQRGDEYVQVATLTGGTRFNIFQPFSTVGTYSAHTPLYLFANWLALNNPYKYVRANNGDFDWTDTDAWQEVLDPAFVMDSDDGLVGGLPTADAGSTNPNTVGTVNEAPYCFFWGDPFYESYYPFYTPTGFLPGGHCDRTGGNDGGFGGPPWGGTGSPEAATAPGTNLLDGASASVSAQGRVNPRGLASANSNGVVDEGLGAETQGSFPLPEPQFTPTPPPPANPAGSGIVWTPRAWVPNNTDGDTSSASAPATYFDVTLGGSGTVTLANFAATIDSLKIVSAGRRLLISDTGSLTTWLSPEITAGFLTVNGQFTSRRNIWLLGGALEGTGRVTLNPTSLFAQTTGDTLYNIAGIVSPGSASTVGTLTIDGNIQFASLSTYLVTIGSGGADRLDVIGGGALDSANASLRVNLAGGYIPTFGSTYNVISTGDGLLTGGFVTNGVDLPGVLTTAYSINTSPEGFDYGVLTVTALPFASAATYTTSEQIVMAKALDDIRSAGGYPALASLYNSLDPTTETLLPTAFEALSPLNALAATGVAEAGGRLIARTISDRADQLISGGGHGIQIAGLGMLGLGPQLASADPYDAMMMGAAAVVAAQEQAAAMGNFRLKEGWGGFLNVTSLVDSRLVVTDFIGDVDLSGTGGSLGIDYSFEDGQGFVGTALSYFSGDTDAIFGIQTSDTDSYAASVYGGARFGGAFLTGQVGYSKQSYDLERVVPLLLGNQVLSADPDGSAWTVTAKGGYDFMAMGGAITPYLAVNAIVLHVDDYSETGGSAALSFDEREVTEFDGRVGLAYKGAFDIGGGTLRPKASIAYAVDLKNGDNDGLVAAFTGFSTVPLLFTDVQRDSGWVEYDIGVEYEGDTWGVALSYYGADNGQLDTGAVSGRVSIAW